MQTYSSVEEARRSGEEIKTRLKTKGFNLTNFLSIKTTIIENLLEEIQAEIELISPFAIKIRCIFQKSIQEGGNWNKLVSECYQQELHKLMNEFDSMTSIQFSRCLIHNINGTHYIHTFTYASMSEIAAMVNVRTTNADASYPNL